MEFHRLYIHRNQRLRHKKPLLKVCDVFQSYQSWFQKTANLSANADLYQAIYNVLQRAIQIPEYGNARETALQFLRHLQSLNTWDPLYFLNLCRTSVQSKDTALQKLLEDIHEIEFQTLFRWTFQHAVGAL